MSTVKKAEGKKYAYSVSAKTEARVRRVFGNGAEDVLKKLRKGQIVGKGPHTFRPEKKQILPKAVPETADNTPTEEGDKKSPSDDGKGTQKK